MRRTITIVILSAILVVIFTASCRSKNLTLSPVEVVKKNIEATIMNDYNTWISTLEEEKSKGFSMENNGEFGVISLTINRLEEVSDQHHIEMILQSENAKRLGITVENIALVDSNIDVEYDGAKVPEISGNVSWRYILTRTDKNAPWLIREWGYGTGGI